MGDNFRKEIFLALIPNLKNEEGHQFVYHSTLLSEFLKESVPIKAFVDKTCEIHPLPEDWVRFFAPKDNSKFSFFQTVRRFLDFCTLFLQVKESKRTFFLESFNTSDLGAFVFAALFFAKKQDRLIILFRAGLPQYRFSGKIHLFLCTLLKYRLKRRFYPVTDSELIKQSFRKKLEMDVVPIPHVSEAIRLRKKRGSSLFWWPGEPRAAKGKKEVERVISHSVIENHWVTFAFSHAFSPKRIHPDVNVRLLNAPLTRQEYLRVLGEADVVLLPYDPIVYRYGTSGIFVECVSAGKMPVVREGSWLAFELKKYQLEELILDWDGEDLLSEMIRLKEDKNVRAKLDAMRKHYFEYHSAKHLVESLKNLC